MDVLCCAVQAPLAAQGCSQGFSGVDGDDRLNPRKGFPERLLDPHPECCELGRAVAAGTLERDPDGAVSLDSEELDIATVRDERRPDSIEPCFDRQSSRRRIIPCLRHAVLIGDPDGELNPLEFRPFAASLGLS
jgi:hypothetical protein